MLAHPVAMLAHLGAMLAHLGGYVAPSWGYVSPSCGLCWPLLAPVGPSWATSSEKWQKMVRAQNTVKRGSFWRHGEVGGRGRGPSLLRREEKRLRLCHGPLAGIFKRLRATAGQGPNYVGPSCGYAGLCWPMLTYLAGNVGPAWSYVGPAWGYVGLSWRLRGPILRLMLAHVDPSWAKRSEKWEQLKTL